MTWSVNAAEEREEDPPAARALKRNHGRLTSERQAHQRTQSLLPDPAARELKRQDVHVINMNDLERERCRGERRRPACCSSAQAPRRAKLLVFYASTRSRRAVEVIICMITRDFSVISIDVTGVSLSLSLSLSLLLTKVTHAQYRKRFRVSYNVLGIE